MKTIKENTTSEIIIKNSRFITLLYKVNNIDMVKLLLDETKNTYKEATHYCYAYIIDNEEKSTDDGEPGGTAGLPILQVLKKNNLNYVLAVVIRYFGGIKLGAGGLVRAYTKSVTNALDNNNLVSLIKGYNITISFDYKDVKEVDYLLKDNNINNKVFTDKIEYNLDVSEDIFNKIKVNSNINILNYTNKLIEIK
jgi:uncharacterized YigZ family protein